MDVIIHNQPTGQSSQRKTKMKEPGLENRHRNRTPPKRDRISQKHGNTLNENLPNPIPGFPRKATLSEIRAKVGKTSEKGVRQAAKKKSGK
jgi:hypothetical protein